MDYKKITNALGKDTMSEMEAMSEEDLKGVVYQASQAMNGVRDELEKNEKYQEIKKQKAALESSKKEIDKRQTARISYSLYLLNEKGKSQ